MGLHIHIGLNHKYFHKPIYNVKEVNFRFSIELWFELAFIPLIKNPK